MSWPNFCKACGAPAPAPPTALHARLRSVARGCRCAECGAKIAGPAWGAGVAGALIGGFFMFGAGLWRASVAPPPPLPALTVQPSPSGFSPSTAALAAETSDGAPPSISNESHRCGAKTKSGRPCRRLVRGKTGYCWQHRPD
jgi:hypothetical protein